MTAPVTHFKVGVLAIAAIAAIIVIAVALGVRSAREPIAAFHVLFDESIEGLDAGATVSYRGVRIGRVAEIDVAGDHRHIDVELAISAAEAERLALATRSSALCATLSSQGVTGVRFVDLDFADAADAARADGPHVPGVHYIAARTSLAKELEDQARKLGGSLPALVEDARVATQRLGDALADVASEHLAARTGAFVDEARATLQHARDLPAHARVALDAWARVADDTRGSLAGLDKILDQVGGTGGLVTAARRVATVLDAVGQHALDATGDFQAALHDASAAARQIRELADELERDPDMLVKGRAPARRP